jgi:hypothetical protein
VPAKQEAHSASHAKVEQVIRRGCGTLDKQGKNRNLQKVGDDCQRERGSHPRSRGDRNGANRASVHIEFSLHGNKLPF